DELNERIETPEYIHSDPVQFMHVFESKKDREIAGFLSALLAWGRRDIVCRKIEELLRRMDFQPARFVESYTPSMADAFRGFKHRTFKATDIHGFISAFQQLYLAHEDFESFWKECLKESNRQNREMLALFHHRFLQLSPEISSRTHKHISNPEKNSSCKRITMFLRWTLRKGSQVDPGIWNFLQPSDLMIPLDVHVARQARRFGLLTRRYNDWMAVRELTRQLRILNPEDPSRYDFALFGLGALNYSLPDRFKLNPVG
ncbi:MAG: TIGR02757 family protein, partial [Balneolaceae bacterium]